MKQRLTVTDLAERLERPARWVRQQAAASAIPAIRVGHTWRFDPDEIDAWERRQHNAYRDPLSMTDLSAKRQELTR